MNVVKLTERGLGRVLGGVEGMTFLAEIGDRGIAQARDYRYPSSTSDHQIWSLGMGDYEVVRSGVDAGLNRAAFSSDFALLDVKKGRRDLTNRLKRGDRIPVTIQGVLQSAATPSIAPKWSPWSNDDGESVEFAVDVEQVFVGP